MSAASRRISNYTTRSVGSDHDTSSRPRSGEEGKKEIWTSMLDGVSSGKRLPEKSLLVLGIYGAQVLDTGVI